MPGRPVNDDASEREDSRRAAHGQIPFAAFFLLATVSTVFCYGIYLKATGPVASERAAASTHSALASAPDRAAPPEADEAAPLAGKPAGSRGVVGPGGEDPGAPDESPILPEYLAEGASADDHAGAAPKGPGSPGLSPAAPAQTNPALAPRGSAPSSALRLARELAGAKNYTAAAQAWGDWARTVPSTSWTVQIAAIRLENAGKNGSLEKLLGRDDAFLLPPGLLPGGWAPVCVGTYDSEQAARRAVSTMGRTAGSSGSPIAKPLASLLPER